MAYLRLVDKAPWNNTDKTRKCLFFDAKPTKGKKAFKTWKSFKKMPFMLAKDTAADLVPIGMSGLFTLKRKGSWHLNPTTIKIKFGDVISSEKIKDMNVDELRDEMFKRIAALVERE
jgi:1-acyl-sn-glycerol-3-phosphate acyltransferase